ERGLYDIVVDHPGNRHPRTGEPDQHHDPARDQHDRAVVAAYAEEYDEADAGDRGGGKGEPCDAGGDGRVDDGDTGDQYQPANPHEGTIAEMSVPSVEVEIGEEEDDEGGSQAYFGSRAPYLFVAGRYLDDLVEE